jgi:2-succinyl-6-hydroxy-2,4-cyclohexadiene-1-carboxylate synthase
MLTWVLSLHCPRKILPALTQLAYTVHPGQGPYLMLLHGFLSSSAQWMHNLEALGRVCTPVTVDLWGHGNSPAPVDETYYHPSAYVAALEQIRERLGADQWYVCGYSIGAGITINYVLQHPQHVIAHLFTNSSSGFADDLQIDKWRTDAEDSANNIMAGGLAAIERIAVHPRFAKRLPTDVYDALMDDARKLSPVGIANTLRQTTPNVSVREIVNANPRPALLCYGNQEKRFALAKEWAAQNMANLTIADLDAGHAVNMEDSAGFNRCATEFISRHRP